MDVIAATAATRMESTAQPHAIRRRRFRERALSLAADDVSSEIQMYEHKVKILDTNERIFFKFCVNPTVHQSTHSLPTVSDLTQVALAKEGPQTCACQPRSTFQLCAAINMALQTVGPTASAEPNTSFLEGQL